MTEPTVATPARRLLFNPGPTNVSEEVRRALLTADFSHRDPAFREVLTRVVTTLPDLLGGRGTHSCVLFAGSATGAMEAVVAAIDGGLLVLVNGRYSERIAAISERLGVPTRRCRLAEFEPPDLDELDRAMAAAAAAGLTHLAVVHHETTSGALLPLAAIGARAREHGLRMIVDGVSSVGGHDFDLRRDNVAYLTLNPNKCLESLPGVGIVLARDDELESLAGRSRSFYFDLHAQWQRLQLREVPYTMPVQVVFALDVALARLRAEGYGRRVERYARMSAYTRGSLLAAGLEPIELPAQIRGNILTTLRLPPGLDFARLHDRLQEEGMTIYTNTDSIEAGRFFVATMGAIEERDVDRFVAALDRAIREQGVALPLAAPA